jgi:hypothetical protein
MPRLITKADAKREFVRIAFNPGATATPRAQWQKFVTRLVREGRTTEARVARWSGIMLTGPDWTRAYYSETLRRVRRNCERKLRRQANAWRARTIAVARSR